jgi:N-acylneuraminate cytidylyltransferase
MGATSVFDGRVKAVIVPKERALDIDTELDLAFAEFLMSRSEKKQQ